MDIRDKLPQLIYVTPVEGRRLVALQLQGDWIEVHNGEILLIHRYYLWELENCGMQVAEGEKVYATPEEAEAADPKFRYTPNSVCE